jgi:hypothetical protein
MSIFPALLPPIRRAHCYSTVTWLKTEPGESAAMNLRPEQLQKIKPFLFSFFFLVRPAWHEG